MTLVFKLTERSKCTFLLEQNLPLVICGTKNENKKVIISLIHLFHVSSYSKLALESISQLMPETLLANTVAIFMPVILDRVLFKDWAEDFFRKIVHGFHFKTDRIPGFLMKA